MDRRAFLAAGALGALAGCDEKASPGPSRNPASTSPSRSTSGSTTTSWRAFEESLDGDLLRRGEPGYRAAKRLYNPRFDPVRPVAVVRAESAGDVASTIDFARQHGLRLVPRSGGHSYVGASTVADGIQLDLRGMNGIRVDGDVVHVGAGARLFDVHRVLEARRLTIPTGTCPTVGVAGLTLGGGIGVESRAYGLTCDALRSVTIVTADGRVRTASRSEDPDLFWVCQGGGGGGFGVVTRLTFRTFPARRVDLFFLSFDDSQATRVLRGWLRRQRQAPRSSWSNVHLDALRGGGIGLRIVGVSLTSDGHREAAALERAIGVAPTRASFSTRTHHEATKLLAGCSSLSDADCHLAPEGTLGREAFAAGSDVVVSLRTAPAVVAHVRARGRAGHGGSLILDPLGGAVAEGSGAFPWRRAPAIAQWYVGLPLTPSPAAVASAYDWIRGGHRAFGDSSLGAYVNYLEPGRTRSAYYGSSLPRLRQVKSAVDPEDFFHTPWSVRPA